MSKHVRFARIHPDAKLPTSGTRDSAGYDVYLVDRIRVPAQCVALLKTGIVAKPPLGYHFELCLRSSTPIKYPGLILANGIGVIDADYCGPEDEIRVLVLNTTSYDMEFKKGARIAQLILRTTYKPEIKEIAINDLRDQSRGGFGSTDGKDG